VEGIALEARFAEAVSDRAGGCLAVGAWSPGAPRSIAGRRPTLTQVAGDGCAAALVALHLPAASALRWSSAVWR